MQSTPPAAWWLTFPEVVPERLRTPEKVAALTPSRLEQYWRAQSRLILQPDGPQPGGSRGAARGFQSRFQRLDMRSLTAACGANCTADGIHYAPTVSDAALQLLLHGLLPRTG